MPSRVAPTETPEHSDQEMPTLAESSTTNNASFVDNIQEQENVNEQLLKEIDEIYSPVLKLMKLFGIYFGSSFLKCLASNSGRPETRSILSKIHCAVVASGLWLNVLMALTGIFFEDDAYLFIMFTLWTLFVALGGMATLLSLRLNGTKKSRFEKFVLNVLSAFKDINLGKVKAKAKKGIVMYRFFALTIPAWIVAFQLLPDANPGNFYPWNQWSGCKIVFTIFFAVGICTWLLPVLFICITCLILQCCIDDLQKGISPLHSTVLDFETLKLEYHKLCKVVKAADKMLAPLFFVLVSVYIPLLCFCFYNVANPPVADSFGFGFLVGYFFSFLVICSSLAVILLFGSKVSEKVNSFQEVLQNFSVSTADEQAKILMLLLDLQANPKGLSIGGLVVITKSMSLTITGVIISYFAVMLSLPK